MKQITTTVGDSEYQYVEAACQKLGLSMYAFAKESIIRAADKAMEGQVLPWIPEMIEALRGRKWGLYQMQDYSDHNQLEWLRTRFPKSTDRARREAVSMFRTKVSE